MNGRTTGAGHARRVVDCAAEAGRVVRICRGLLAGLEIAALLMISVSAMAQVLGTAANFAVLSATPNAANSGASVISGSVGVWSAAATTGFPPGTIVAGTGLFHYRDDSARVAESDAAAGYQALARLSSIPVAPELGGLTLLPGVYAAGAAALTGTLTLDGPGLYVFRAASLTTASGPGASVVRLINGATPCDVWWQVDGPVALGSYSAMRGNILALRNITLGMGATLEGRALALNGTVTLDTNTVTACSGGTSAADLGFLVPPLMPIPTLSEWAMIMLATLLGIAGLTALRR